MNVINDKKNMQGKMIYKDSQEHNLHTMTDHRDPRYGLSYNHIEPKIDDITDVKDHPAKNLPQPAGGGEEPRSIVAKKTGAPPKLKKEPYGPSEGKPTHGGAPRV